MIYMLLCMYFPPNSERPANFDCLQRLASDDPYLQYWIVYMYMDVGFRTDFKWMLSLEIFIPPSPPPPPKLRYSVCDLVFCVGVLTLLKFPYPRCVEEPETYDQVRVHAEWGAATSRPESQKPTFAVSQPIICTCIYPLLLIGHTCGMGT